MRGGPDDAELFPEIDGRSPPIRRLKEHMRRVARHGDVTVLLLGESGTGKERVARAIHRVSPRGRAPFVVVNCAGLSPSLVEDELFGHVRGAFTGAIADQPGPFERANGGTVFLDEVGDLPIDLQKKLLRALQQRAVLRLGGRQETAFDVRVIAATNVDLARALAEARFREDLYFRLKVYEVKLPPLRRRGAADLAELAGAILKRLGARRRAPYALDPRALDLLVRYDWPGNVRELENTLECMTVAGDGATVLTTAHLPEGFGASGPAQGARHVGLPPVAEVLAALERNHAHRARAAAELGVSRHQLYRLLQRHGVRSQSPR